MSIQSVLLPVLVQVALVFALLGLTAKRRQDAFKGGLPPDRVALSSDAYPPAAKGPANSYSNQFEMPVLFLFAVIFGIVLHQTGWLFVLLEWVFVAFRIAHAVLHVTINKLPLRGALFIASAAITALLWILIFLGTFFGTVLA